MPGTCHFGCFYFRCRQDIPCESDAIRVLAVFNKTYENGGKEKDGRTVVSGQHGRNVRSVHTRTQRRNGQRLTSIDARQKQGVDCMEIVNDMMSEI